MPSELELVRQWPQMELPVLPWEEQVSLALAAQNGDMRARSRLVDHSYRLAYSELPKRCGFGVPAEDLMIEGLIGINRAIDKYQPQAARFSTYALQWIVSFMNKAMGNQSRTIRYPYGVGQKSNAIYRARKRLEKAGGAPTTAELAAETGLTEQEVERLECLPEVTTSLDDPIDGYEPDPLYLGDVIAADCEIPGESTPEQDAKDTIVDLFRNLSPAEATVISLRWGLDGRKPQTLREVGAQIGFSAESARKVEHDALRRLRWYANNPGAEHCPIRKPRPLTGFNPTQMTLVFEKAA